jgi:siroheme synthase (precorrin-2 oxidase/ferrochelatase)
VAFDWHPSTGALWTGTSDVAAGAFEIGDGPNARAAVVVALDDGTLQRHVVVAAVPSRILQRAALADAPKGRATALVRSRHGHLIVAVSEPGKAPVVRVLDPR